MVARNFFTTSFLDANTLTIDQCYVAVDLLLKRVGRKHHWLHLLPDCLRVFQWASDVCSTTQDTPSDHAFYVTKYHNCFVPVPSWASVHCDRYSVVVLW